MKFQVAAVVCLTAAAFGQGPAQNWVDPNHSEPAGTHYRTFHSQLAGSDVSYLIYLPPDYDASSARRRRIRHTARRGDPRRQNEANDRGPRQRPSRQLLL